MELESERTSSEQAPNDDQSCDMFSNGLAGRVRTLNLYAARWRLIHHFGP